jgi:Group 4 capsule polysaccharide lipoprotein gfcB, YjbF
MSEIPSRPTRRKALLGSGALLLASCSNTKQPDMSTALGLFERSLADRDFTDEDVARIPYASLGVKVGDAPEILVVLAGSEPDGLHWRPADGSLLVTRHGRITRVSGRITDVRMAPGDGDDPVAAGRIGASETEDCIRLLDFPKVRRYGVVVRSVLRRVGDAPVDLLRGEARAVKFSEIGGSDVIGWQFENEFYLDPRTGRILKSRQSATPEAAPFELRILRPFDGTEA